MAAEKTCSVNELKTQPFVWPIRVYFEDTDAGGVVYHSRYLNFFERARTEMLRAMGIPQMQLKDQHGLIWVVLEMNIRFRKAAKLDDELLATAAFEWIKGARLGLSQNMTRTSDGAVIATADLSVVMLHADTHKPARMPAWITAELEKHATK